MTTKRTLVETQTLPAVETMADLVARDPARIYHHRQRLERIEIPPTRPASKWSRAALARLLRRVTGTGAKIALLGLLVASCETEGVQAPRPERGTIAVADAGVDLLLSPDVLATSPDTGHEARAAIDSLGGEAGPRLPSCPDVEACITNHPDQIHWTYAELMAMISPSTCDAATVVLGQAGVTCP